jgi:hypothetical protein
MKLTKEQSKERTELTREYRNTNGPRRKSIKDYMAEQGFLYVEGPLGEQQSYFLTPEEYKTWEFTNPQEVDKPSFRYNVIFMALPEWDAEYEEVGRYGSNNPFPDLSKGDEVKIKGKRYLVSKKRVEYDPDESLVVIYEMFCTGILLGGDEE